MAGSVTPADFKPGTTVVQRGAFKNRKDIKSVELPDTIERIEEDAFSGCSAVTGELALPDGLTAIGKSAFKGCSGFTCQRHG